MKRNILSALAILVLCMPVVASGATWQVDPGHSSFQFKIRHLMVSNVKGDFTKSRGTIIIDDQDIANWKIEVIIDSSSVSTDHAKRDEHLRSPDFFDVAKYPNITFVSKKVTKADPGRLKVIGDLTIRETTREVVVDVEGPTPEVKDPSGSFRRGATATSKINRKDFGITWNRLLDTGGAVVGDEVTIIVELELIKK